jgi:hypothetical protein
MQKPLSAGPDQTAIFNYEQMATLAFWDAYLKGDKNGRDWLASDALATYSHGEAMVSRK